MRKLIPAVLALFAAGACHALGFGELSLNSALNQPLDATVELLAVKPSERESVKVQIADPDMFERFGLFRSPALDDVQVKVTPIPGSNHLRVSLTSRGPVREPFLSLLLEAAWQGGRALREYTVLLDPPVETPAAAPAATTRAPRQSGRDTARAPENARPAPAPAPVTRTSAPRSTRTGAGGQRRYGPVVNRETLWGIAREVRPDSRIGMNQMLVALYRANPQAFGGNMNRLYAGATLDVPDADEIRAIDRRAAQREVMEQEQAYKYSRSGGRSAPAPEAPAPVVAEAPPEVGELRLEPPSPTAAETASAGGGGEGVEDSAVASEGDEQAMTEAGAAETGESAESKPGLPVAGVPAARDVASAESDSVVPEGSQNVLTWRNILLLLALLALVVTPFLWLRRRQQRYEPLSSDFSTIGDADTVPAERLPEDDTVTSLPPASAMSVDELLADADNYVQNELYDEALTALNIGLEARPDSTALKRKVLEVHYSAGSRDAFVAAAERYFPEPDENDPDWRAVAAMGRSLAPDEARFAGVPGPEEAEEPEVPEAPEEETAPSEEADTTTPSDEFELDFDFDDESASGDQGGDDETARGGADAAPPSLDVDFSEFESREEETAKTDTDETAERPEAEEGAPDEDEFADFDFDSLSIEETDTSAGAEESAETVADADTDEAESEESKEVTTKLDLARAYLDMGEVDMARGLLEEVKDQGNTEQRREAEDLLERAG